MEAYVIGIDIGATNIKTVAVTRLGELLFESQQPTEDNVVDWAERIRSEIARIEALQSGKAESIGIAAPGFAHPNRRCIAWMQGRMESLQGLDWTNYLGSETLIPVLNDANAALLGEVWQGAARGEKNVVLLTLGTGVGGAALVDGKLLRGNLGRAGHLGHISLNPNGALDIVRTPGSLEDAIGECTLLRRTNGRFATTLELVRAHRSGDSQASSVWLESVRALAAAVVSLINVLDPETLILGGGIVRAGDALLVPLQEWVNAWEWRPTGNSVRLVTAELGEMAGAWGAAYESMQS